MEMLKKIMFSMFSKEKVVGYVIGGLVAGAAVGLNADKDKIEKEVCKTQIEEASKPVVEIKK